MRLNGFIVDPVILQSVQRRFHLHQVRAVPDYSVYRNATRTFSFLTRVLSFLDRNSTKYQGIITLTRFRTSTHVSRIFAATRETTSARRHIFVQAVMDPCDCNTNVFVVAVANDGIPLVVQIRVRQVRNDRNYNPNASTISTTVRLISDSARTISDLIALPRLVTVSNVNQA